MNKSELKQIIKESIQEIIHEKWFYDPASNQVNMDVRPLPLNIVPDEEAELWLQKQYPNEAQKDYSIIRNQAKLINLLKDCIDDGRPRLFIRTFFERIPKNPSLSKEQAVVNALKIAKKYFTEYYGSQCEYNKEIDSLLSGNAIDQELDRIQN